jgi:riboflavin kinase/FMN adenylyltransferase
MSVRIFRSLDEVPADFGPCALTIGNFDGVHLGHRTILRRVCELARANGWKAAAMTFEPHPAEVVAPERVPRMMTTPARRSELMAEEGIEEILILPFTSEIARLTPEEFVRVIVVDRLNARAVLVGHNFRFGHKQAGDERTLFRLGEIHGFAVEALAEVKVEQWKVSSTAIRQAVKEGRMAKARRMLLKPFSLQGDVVSGKGIGSRQTVPTLNLHPDSALLPMTGVYVTRTFDRRDGRCWPSITNVGFRPTFDGESLTVETFLLAELEGNTPQQIRVEFLRRLRDERRFEHPEALKNQILLDVQKSRKFFARLSKWDNSKRSHH